VFGVHWRREDRVVSKRKFLSVIVKGITPQIEASPGE